MAVTETNQNRRSVWAQRVTLDAPDFAGGTATVFAPGVVATDDIDISSDAGPGFSFTGRVTAPGVVEIYQQLEPGAGGGNPVVQVPLPIADMGLAFAPMPILPTTTRATGFAVLGTLPGDTVIVQPADPPGALDFVMYRGICNFPGNVIITLQQLLDVPVDMTGAPQVLDVLAFRPGGGGGGGGSYPALPGPTEFSVQAFRTLNMAYGISG